MAKSSDTPAFVFEPPIRIRDVGYGQPEIDEHIRRKADEIAAHIRELDVEIEEREAHLAAMREQLAESMTEMQAMVRAIAQAIADDPDYGKDHELYKIFKAIPLHTSPARSKLLILR